MLKIRELRENLSLTQKELGSKLGIDGHNIGDWEREKCEPSSEMLIKLADIFECTVDYLIGREDDFGNVISSAGNGAELSRDEKELLRLFDKLNLFEREAMMIQMRALAEKKPINK